MSHLSLGVILGRIVIVMAFFWSFSAFSQTPGPRMGSTILDDTTKNVYGPKTSRWTTEDELFANRPNYRPLDTAINNYHRWTYIQRFNNYYKDLGVVGTALNSIFPTAPTSIGAWAGFTAYEQYYATEEPRYFDTKSPFTRMHVIWGGKGRAITDIEFSRNINPRWNFGFNYRPILVEKQIQSKGKNDKQITSHYYDFYTTYHSKNNRYLLLANYRRIRHRVIETGGVVPDETDPARIYAPDGRPFLINAKTEEYRRNIHVFQHFQLAEALQLYQKSDFTVQENVFTDLPGTEPTDYYDHFEPVSTDSTFDKVTFRSQQQEVGIKGNASKLFYSGYYKFRTYDYHNRYLDTVKLPIATSGVENYLGGSVSLSIDSASQFSGEAEYMLAGYYRIEGQIQTPWIEGYFKNSLSKPGFMQQIYWGSHDYWKQTFVGTNSTQAQGFLKFNSEKVKLKAGGTFTLLRNYVYFKQVTQKDTSNAQTVLPLQSSGIQSTFSPEVRLTYQFWRHLFLRPQVIYTAFLSNDDGALKIPEVFVNCQLAYENMLFKNHLQLQAGFDTHWHSTYYALGYDTPMQQFYVQNTTLSPAFPLVDVFVTGKMRRGRFFFKYHNLVQAFTLTGYLPTPGYPGQRNVIDFGFDFLLFD